MAWPQGQIPNANVSSETSSPALARVDFLNLINQFNQLVASDVPAEKIPKNLTQSLRRDSAKIRSLPSTFTSWAEVHLLIVDSSYYYPLMIPCAPFNTINAGSFKVGNNNASTIRLHTARSSDVSKRNKIELFGGTASNITAAYLSAG